MAMAIAAAFEEINTSQTGEITLKEFRLAYRKNGIETYNGITQIFERLSQDGQHITLPDFIAAFQGGTIFANRAEPPKLKEVLTKLGIIQFAFIGGDMGGSIGGTGDGAVGGNTESEYQTVGTYRDDDEEGSINTMRSDGTQHTQHTQHIIGRGYDYNSTKRLLDNPETQNQQQTTITPMSRTINNAHDDHNVIHDTDHNVVTSYKDNNGGYSIVGSPETIDNGPTLQSPTISTTLGEDSILRQQQQQQRSFMTNPTTLHQVQESHSLKNLGEGNNNGVNPGIHARNDTLNTDKRPSMSGDSGLIFRGDTDKTVGTGKSNTSLIKKQSHHGMAISNDTIEIEMTQTSADHSSNTNNDSNNGIEAGRTRVRSLTNEKSPQIRVTLSWKESLLKVLRCFKSIIIVALPGVLLNAILHFVQGGATFAGQWPLVDITWYLFGFLVYLALQGTMVGFQQTKSLLLFSFTIAGGMGALLIIATAVEYAIEEQVFGENTSREIRDTGIMWWSGLFIVTLICECAARLKFMKVFGSQRTKREYCWYASSHAIGVAVFWLVQTLISSIVVSVSFDDDPKRRWPIIIYCTICLTILRNLSLNTLGTAFIARLSDHFYLEDVEMSELKTDQMLLTQLSIISSYSSLWYLFTKTIDSDWIWVLIGIITYQLLLLLMDVALKTYIRPKMIQLLKGELIAWLAVGAKAIMNFIYPFGFNSKFENEYNKDWNKYITKEIQNWNMNIGWIAVYITGPILVLILLWLRIYKLWDYENIESYWDFEDFTFSFCNKSKNNNSQSPNSTKSNKQRNRLMILCALTIGFVVSVTEAVTLWTDNPDSQKYEGLLQFGQ